MTPEQQRAKNREIFESLQPGDRIEMKHEVKVGLTRWPTATRGDVVKTTRRRHGLHWKRNADDKVYRDEILLRLDDGSLSTVTVDEFSELQLLANVTPDEPYREPGDKAL